MLKLTGNVIEPDIYVVVVTNRIQFDYMAPGANGAERLQGRTTANEKSIATQETLPWC